MKFYRLNSSHLVAVPTKSRPRIWIVNELSLYPNTFVEPGKTLWKFLRPKTKSKLSWPSEFHKFWKRQPSWKLSKYKTVITLRHVPQIVFARKIRSALKVFFWSPYAFHLFIIDSFAKKTRNAAQWPHSPYVTISHFFHYTPSPQCHQANSDKLFLDQRPEI